MSVEPALLPGFRSGMLEACRVILEYELEHNIGYRRRLSEAIHNHLKELEMKMNQKGTTRGLGGESGEREPKGATSSDPSGQKRVSVPKADRVHGAQGVSGERIPEASSAMDKTGEKRVAITGGVGQGQHDKIVGREPSHAGKPDGQVGELNTGRAEGVAYKHQKAGY